MLRFFSRRSCCWYLIFLLLLFFLTLWDLRLFFLSRLFSFSIICRFGYFYVCLSYSNSWLGFFFGLWLIAKWNSMIECKILIGLAGRIESASLHVFYQLLFYYFDNYLFVNVILLFGFISLSSLIIIFDWFELVSRLEKNCSLRRVYGNRKVGNRVGSCLVRFWCVNGFKLTLMTSFENVAWMFRFGI